MYHAEKLDLADLYHRSPLPLYLQVADLLRRRITAGQWTPEQQLPSLEALGKKFGVARLTARQAVEQLESEGLIRRKQGKGTFVTATVTTQRWLNLETRWSDLVKMVEKTSLELLYEKERVACPDLGAMAGIPAKSYHFMRRIHLKDKEPYCLAEIYLSEETFKKAPEHFRQKTVVSVLDSMPEIHMKSGRQILTIGTADPYMANYLNIAVGSSVANQRRVVLDNNDSVIYLGDIVYSGHHVKLDIDLKI